MDGVDFELPPDVRLAQADDLKAALLALLSSDVRRVRLNGRRIRLLDLAGLQLLLAFVRTCEARKVELRWTAASDELREWAKVACALELLGL